MADVLSELRALREAMVRTEIEEAATLAATAPHYRASARNLLHFIAFHRLAHPGLRRALRDLGLSSLVGCDAHLMASVTAVIAALRTLEGCPPDSADAVAPPAHHPAPDQDQGLELMRSHCDLLFGPPPAPGAASIMVTLPVEAAHHPSLIRDLVEAGMTVARINCAHDGPLIWRRFVERVHAASAATGRACRIAMDLAGPKLRTGELPPLSGVIRVRPRRDRLGRLLEPAWILAEPVEAPTAGPPGSAVLLPTAAGAGPAPEVGDRLQGKDASGRRRDLEVVASQGGGLLLRCEQACHFTAGLVFAAEQGPGRLEVAPLPPAPGEVLLRPGDRLRLTATATGAADAVPCSLPQVFADLRPGERVLFDEGRIGAVILSVSAGEVLLEIRAAKARGSRLRADKGINFPDSDLHTPALTPKDLEDLAFATAHADLVSYSFVNRESDIEALHRALERHGRADLPVVLKIETRRAFVNLPRLLLAAMRYPAPLGVMIARGDLAIECGWHSLAEIQEEILRICEAAHLPCIWATQVLDEMARHGTPTRAEITDAAMGARAEALMLNKGPNITDAVRTLQGIMRHSHPDPMRSCLSFRTNCEAMPVSSASDNTPAAGA